MSTLREQVANFIVAPKYGLKLGEENADLLIGMIRGSVNKSKKKELTLAELLPKTLEKLHEHR